MVKPAPSWSRQLVAPATLADVNGALLSGAPRWDAWHARQWGWAMGWSQWPCTRCGPTARGAWRWIESHRCCCCCGSA